VKLQVTYGLDRCATSRAYGHFPALPCSSAPVVLLFCAFPAQDPTLATGQPLPQTSAGLKFIEMNMALFRELVHEGPVRPVSKDNTVGAVGSVHLTNMRRQCKSPMRTNQPTTQGTRHNLMQDRILRMQPDILPPLGDQEHSALIFPK